MKALGLDIGERKIGFATGDTALRIASPRGVIVEDGRDAKIATIKNIVETENIGVVIAGMPYNLKGEIAHQAKKVITFLKHLSRALDVPVETVDERMTSRITKNKDDDSIAASMILQTWFDRQLNNEVIKD